MRLHSECDPSRFCLFDIPTELVDASVEGVRGTLAGKQQAGESGHVTTAAGIGVVQLFQETFSCFSPTATQGLIHRVDVRVRIQKHKDVRRSEPPVIQFSFEISCGPSDSPKLTRRLKVGAPLEQADVGAFETQRCDEIQNLVVGASEER